MWPGHDPADPATWPGHFGIFECGRVNLGPAQSLRPGQILEGISCGRVSKKCGFRTVIIGSNYLKLVE